TTTPDGWSCQSEDACALVAHCNAGECLTQARALATKATAARNTPANRCRLRISGRAGCVRSVGASALVHVLPAVARRRPGRRHAGAPDRRSRLAGRVRL